MIIYLAKNKRRNKNKNMKFSLKFIILVVLSLVIIGMLAYTMYLLDSMSNSMHRIAVGSIGLTCAIGAIAEKTNCQHEVNRRINAILEENTNSDQEDE